MEVFCIQVNREGERRSTKCGGDALVRTLTLLAPNREGMKDEYRLISRFSVVNWTSSLKRVLAQSYYHAMDCGSQVIVSGIPPVHRLAPNL